MAKKKTVSASNAKPANTQRIKSEDHSFFQRYSYYFLAAILLITAAIYIPSSLENDFTRYWDDENIVVQNPDIREISGETLTNMFTKSYYDMYCPVKILSHTLDYQLFGLDPAGYHIMSLLYHLINILLVFWLIYLMLGSSPAALAAALIYALHPLAVETVSWVTGRGDLLYALFAFLSLINYVKYITKGEKKKYLVYTFIFFVLSGLSKPTAMTLPVTLFVFDWYYRRKIFTWNTIVEKIPFIAISILLGILSIKLRGHGVSELSGFMDFFKSYKGWLFITYPLAFYIIKFIFPLPLSFIYPHVAYYFYNHLVLPVMVWISPLVLIAVLLIVMKAKSMRRPLLFALLFYFTTIFSTLQIVPLNSVSAHDRYFYVPIVGFIFFVAWLYTYFKQKNNLKAIRMYFAVIVIFALSFASISFDRTSVWKSTITLFKDVIKKQPQYVEGYDQLAEQYELLGDYRNALLWTQKTVEARSSFHGVYVRMVRLYISLNEPDSAMLYMPQAIQSATTVYLQDWVYSIKGYLDMQAGRYTDAITDYDILLQISPDSQAYLFQRASAKMAIQQFDAALADFGRYLQMQPDDPAAYINIGRIYADINQLQMSMDNINKAIQLDPNNKDAYFIRGYLFLQMDQRMSACADISKANELGHPMAAEWLENYCR